MSATRSFFVFLIFILSGPSLYGQDNMSDSTKSAVPFLIQPSLNVFRRFEADPEAMYKFYGRVLGFRQLDTYKVENGIGVARFQVGDSQVKLSGFVPGRSYKRGGIPDATGLRLLTFFCTDKKELKKRFKDNGLPFPEFKPASEPGRSHAFVKDPDGQWVELVIVTQNEAALCNGIEIGLVVSDLEKSRSFYGRFIGLEELPVQDDPDLKTKKYSFRHGSTVISLRSFRKELPADTGTGGIQYVVSDAAGIEKLAEQKHVKIDQPLSKLEGFPLLTIWLDDPDGIINYFAQIGVGAK